MYFPSEKASQNEEKKLSNLWDITQLWARGELRATMSSDILATLSWLLSINIAEGDTAMQDAIIQLKGDLSEQHRPMEPKGYRYIRTFANGKLREQNPDCLKYDDFDLFESEEGGEFCYRFWERSVNDIGDGPYLSWSFAVAVTGFRSLQDAIDHALSVYYGDRPEVKPELTEQQLRALAKLYESAIQAALRAEQEEKEQAVAGTKTSGERPQRSEDSSYSDWVENLSMESGLVSARDAVRLVPKRMYGLYAIFIDDARNLPGVFGAYLKQKRSRVIYAGKAAAQTLYKRLVTQDLHQRGPSTFFRGLGAALGFRPPPGSLRGKKNRNNYKFSREDTQAIVAWIEAHLFISWLPISPEDASRDEFFLIETFRPLFNTTHNKDALPELDALKRECRRIARS